MKKKLALVGSTGSVGRQVLAAAKRLGCEVISLTAHTNAALLEKQIEEFHPRVACLTGGGEFFAPKGTATFSGEGSMTEAIVPDADVVFVAVRGFAGLEAVLRAIELGKDVALANKEALVAGGDLVMEAARKKGVNIIPVDSEHSALWQALSLRKEGYKKLILTASGGPFLHAKTCEMRHFSAADALKHPNWSMGKKITVDCATMLNKGFEVIEAHHMFGAPLDRIDVVVHPQSIVHSMVEFDDGSVIAEMSFPDMAQPIQLALTYPEKLPTGIPTLDLIKVGKLEFLPLDRAKFPCFDIAVGSLKMGGSIPCAMNAASEVAVNAFLEDRILFTDIADAVGYTVAHSDKLGISLAELKEADGAARAIALEFLRGREKY